METKLTGYIALETAISMGINVLLSLAFVVAQFHGLAIVPASGPGGLIRDALPQTFAISLMSVLVPTLLTRKRGRERAMPAPSSPRSFKPSHVLLRALMIAAVAATCGVGVTYLIFHHVSTGLSFRGTLVFKACYGALVALIVTPFAVLVALHDVAHARSSGA